MIAWNGTHNLDAFETKKSVIDPKVSTVWAEIPHFTYKGSYMNFCKYFSTGLTEGP